MRLLHHFWLSPFSRKVRIALKEKGLEFELHAEKYWERRPDFLRLNPAGEVPVLQEPHGLVLADSQAIVEYLDEVYSERPLIPGDAADRAEVRRLAAWFDQKFYREVSWYLIREKLLKRFMRLGEPDSELIRAGKRNLQGHLDYVGWLAERRNWLAGLEFSVADIAAAAQLSCLDYLGDVPWDGAPRAKDWYARVKSRPSFRAILADHIPGLPPPRWYADLDF
jgi:glutathione S-transferase